MDEQISCLGCGQFAVVFKLVGGFFFTIFIF